MSYLEIFLVTIAILSITRCAYGMKQCNKKK